MFRQKTVVVDPLLEPLTLAQVKTHLRWDDLPAQDAATQTAIDDDLRSKIAAARERCERFTRLSLITQTIDVWWDREDGLGVLDLPAAPIQSIVGLYTYDIDSAESTVDASTYLLAHESLMLTTFINYARPQMGIRARLIVGFGDDPEDVPDLLTQGMLELIGHWFANPAGQGAGAKYEIEARMAGQLPSQVADKWISFRKVIT